MSETLITPNTSVESNNEQQGVVPPSAEVVEHILKSPNFGDGSMTKAQKLAAAERRATQIEEARKAVVDADGVVKPDAYSTAHDAALLDNESRRVNAERNATSKAIYERHQAEDKRREELQLDTEELHAKLGKPGLRRLLHPFRNARIASTVANRTLKGEYNPSLAQKDVGIFEVDTLGDKRRERARLKEDPASNNPNYFDPFAEDTPVTKRRWRDRFRKNRQAPANSKSSRPTSSEYFDPFKD